MIDKNKAVVDYLITCPDIFNTPLYFNFANIKDKINQVLPLVSDKNINKPYIDGSVEKRYSVTFVTYLSISNNPVVKVEGINNENISDLNTVQALLNWVETQDDLKNYPNFGNDCLIEKIGCTSNNPRLEQIDATKSIPLAKYSFTIYIEYIDKSKILWEE